MNSGLLERNIKFNVSEPVDLHVTVSPNEENEIEYFTVNSVCVTVCAAVSMSTPAYV